MFCVYFFFSSRRRHTRYWRDWSSDVCSSDLSENNTGRNEPSDLSAHSRTSTEVKKERETKEDGRYIIYYTFEDEEEDRSEEHTSELQSRQYLVCRLLLEKKKEILPTSF